VELTLFKLKTYDWIDAGWLLMATKGVTALKVEVLARQLDVSKGSFYWHFKNRQELLEAILQRWENKTLWLIEESQKGATPKDRLIELFTLVEEMCDRDTPDPEAAIFLWANHDSAVQERVRILEAKRVGYLTQLLQEYGFEETEARQKAEVGYFALMGFWERSERDTQFDLSMKQFNHFLIALLLSPVNYSLTQRAETWANQN
jgi:AcrR family transcriptional regulator